MHQALRRIAGATTATVIAGLLVPLTAGSASAVTLTETQFYAADKNGDTTAGLYRRDTATRTEHAVLPDSPTYDVDMLTGSREGSRFAARVTTLDANGLPVRRKLVVFDVGGRAVRVAQDVPASSGSPFRPALSPDGNTLVWSFYNATTNGVTLLRAPATTGGPTVIGTSLGNAVFADGSTLIVESGVSPYAWYSMPAGGGSPTVLPTVPASADHPAVSADGTQLAWSNDTSTSTTDTADIQAAALSVSGGVASVGTPRLVATGLDNLWPSFSRDGTTVYFVKDNGAGGPGAIWSAPADGSGTTGTAVDTTSVGDVYGEAIGTADDGAPASATPTPATLSGTSATVHWTLPADPDLSGVIVNRYLGSTLQRSVYVPAPLRGYVDAGLTLNQTYTYTYRSVDRSGNVGATTSRNLTALKPAPRFADPTSATTTRAPFAVTFEAGVPSNVTFVVYYRANGGSTWYRWVNGATGSRRTFGAPATTNVAATTAYPGYTYQFRVTARDAYGNTSYTVLSGRAVVPFDQTKASFSSGQTRSVSSAWFGSYRVLRLPGSYARLTVVGDRFQVVGFRCATCGVFDVYQGSTRLATVDTRSSSTVARTVLYTRTFSSVGNRTLTIRARGTAGRPNVILDGFSTRR